MTRALSLSASPLCLSLSLSLSIKRGGVRKSKRSGSEFILLCVSDVCGREREGERGESVFVCVFGLFV